MYKWYQNGLALVIRSFDLRVTAIILPFDLKNIGHYDIFVWLRVEKWKDGLC